MDVILAQMPAGTSTTSDPLIDNFTQNQQSNVREDTGSARVDQIFSDKDSAFARLNIHDTHAAGTLAGVSPSAFGLNDKQDVPVRTTNAAIHEGHIFNIHFVNDALAGMQRWVSTIAAYEPVPFTSIGGLTITPGNEGNYYEAGTSFQYGDTLTYVHGKHTINTGGTIYRIQVNRSSTDYNSMEFSSIQDFINNQLRTRFRIFTTPPAFTTS